MKEDINKLFEEITQDSGFINIDQNDVDKFKKNVTSIDATKVSGKEDKIGELFDNAINSLKVRNGNKKILRILFVIKVPQANTLLMGNIEHLYDVLDQFEDGIECQWGLSVSEQLLLGEVEIILFVGI